jgi:class 3 adenylate cyclase
MGAILVFLFTAFLQAEPQDVEIRGQNLSRPIELRSGWVFVPGQLADPSALLQGEPVELPDTWGESRKPPLPLVGYGTYQIRLTLPEAEDLAIQISPNDSPARVFFNGHRVWENGAVAQTPPSVTRDYSPALLRLPRSENLLITIHVSNFEYPRPGLRCKILLGRFTQMDAASRQSIGIDSFLMGAILIMGIYHLTLFLLNRQHRAPVYFAVLCLLIGVRLSVTSEGILYRAGIVNWHEGTFLEYFTFYLAVPAFMLFLRSLYPEETHKLVVRLSVSVGILGALLVTVLPVFYYARTLPAFQAWTGIVILYFAVTIARAILNRRPEAAGMMVGGLVLGATIINDMLFAMRAAETIYVAPGGLFFFFFSQAFVLSRRFSRAFAQVRQLSAELEERVEQRTHELAIEKEKSDKLLENILPEEIARELKTGNAVRPRRYDSVSVMFADFVGFTQASERMEAEELVRELDLYYLQFDEVVERNGLEKLKTMGDNYMSAGGIPVENQSHPVDACIAGLQFLEVMRVNERPERSWGLRIGIHTGPAAAGVVGRRKFAYDIWGDTVNIASRMESTGLPGSVNISGSTYAIVQRFFDCQHRGKIDVKGKGQLDMYTVLRLKPEYAADSEGLLPSPALRAALAQPAA